MINTKIGLLLTAIAFCAGSAQADPYVESFEGKYKEYTDKRLDLIAHFLPEDPIIFEAGGHYGTDTIKFAYQWPSSDILSFEPNPHAFELLQEATIGMENVSIYNLAVNNYNGTATLNVCYGTNGDDPIFEGASSLLESSEWMDIHYQGPKVEVPCVILDDWCATNDIDHIDFMWLDLEGLELQVLTSSPQILSKVKVIYTETNFRPFRKKMTQYKQLRRFLESNGFAMLSHWYVRGLQGNAIFVRKELLDLAP